MCCVTPKEKYTRCTKIAVAFLGHVMYDHKYTQSFHLSVLINCLIIPFGSDRWLWLGLGLDEILVFEKRGKYFQILNYS